MIKIDPRKRLITAIGEDFSEETWKAELFGEKSKEQKWDNAVKWDGAVLGADGRIYATPAMASKVRARRSVGKQRAQRRARGRGSR